MTPETQEHVQLSIAAELIKANQMTEERLYGKKPQSLVDTVYSAMYGVNTSAPGQSRSVAVQGYTPPLQYRTYEEAMNSPEPRDLDEACEQAEAVMNLVDAINDRHGLYESAYQDYGNARLDNGLPARIGEIYEPAAVTNPQTLEEMADVLRTAKLSEAAPNLVARTFHLRQAMARHRSLNLWRMTEKDRYRWAALGEKLERMVEDLEKTRDGKDWACLDHATLMPHLLQETRLWQLTRVMKDLRRRVFQSLLAKGRRAQLSAAEQATQARLQKYAADKAVMTPAADLLPLEDLEKIMGYFKVFSLDDTEALAAAMAKEYVEYRQKYGLPEEPSFGSLPYNPTTFIDSVAF